MRKDRNSTNRSGTKEPNWLLERGAGTALRCTASGGQVALAFLRPLTGIRWQPLTFRHTTPLPPDHYGNASRQADDQRGPGVGILCGGKVLGPGGLDGSTTRKRNKGVSPEFVASPKKEDPIPEFLYLSSAGVPVAAHAGRLYDIFLTIFHAETVINQDKRST